MGRHNSRTSRCLWERSSLSLYKVTLRFSVVTEPTQWQDRNWVKLAWLKGKRLHTKPGFHASWGPIGAPSLVAPSALNSQALKHQSGVSEYSSLKVAELPEWSTVCSPLTRYRVSQDEGPMERKLRNQWALYHSHLTHGHYTMHHCSYLSGNSTAFDICLATLVSWAGRKAACIPNHPEPASNHHFFSQQAKTTIV